MPSITRTFPDIRAEGPILEVHFLIPSALEEEYKKEGKNIPPPIIVKALVDTGASACVIQEDIPKKLGLNPIGSTKISTPSCDGHGCYRYFLRMAMPHQKIVYEGTFIATPLKGQNIECLIGRDLLSMGVLIYIGYVNQFTLSLL